MNDIHAAKPPIETPILTDGQVFALWIFAGFALALFATWLVFKYLSRPTNELPASLPEEPQPDPYDVAMKALTGARKLLDEASWKPFYLSATELVKTYLSHKYRMNVRGRTTRELLGSSKLPERTRSRLHVLVSEMDAAKFANRNLEEGPAYRMFDAVRTFLEEEK